MGISDWSSGVCSSDLAMQQNDRITRPRSCHIDGTAADVQGFDLQGISGRFVGFGNYDGWLGAEEVFAFGVGRTLICQDGNDGPDRQAFPPLANAPRELPAPGGFPHFGVLGVLDLPDFLSS